MTTQARSGQPSRAAPLTYAATREKGREKPSLVSGDWVRLRAGAIGEVASVAHHHVVVSVLVGRVYEHLVVENDQICEVRRKAESPGYWERDR